MNFYLPRELNIDQLLRAYPPKIKGFERWKLLYFVHIVTYLPSVSKKTRNEESGYVNLHSKLLQGVVHNYKHYIDYLIQHDVLEGNKSYSSGSFSKSYRLTSTYATSGFVCMPVTNKEFSRIVQKRTGITPDELRLVNTEYYHIVRHFDGLEYDYEAATKYVSQMLFATLNMPGEYDTRYVSDRLREIEINNLLLKGKEYHCKVDRTSGRFHSILTRLKKEFRHFLSYKGESLVSLDIKCSQPYIAQRLLTHQFWLNPPGSGARKTKPGPKKPRTAEDVNMLDRIESMLGGSLKDILLRTEKVWGLQVDAVEYRIQEEAREGLREVKSITPMLALEVQESDNQSIVNYANLVNQGDIYEHLLAALRSEINSDPTLKALYEEAKFPLDRNSMKAIVLRGFYSPSKTQVPTSILAHRLLEKEFPGVEKIFNRIKNHPKVHYRILALLMQAIESEILLKKVCKRIGNMNPRIPFFTIHDSILTLPRYKDVVFKIMEDEFEKAILMKPRITEESYAQIDMNATTAVLMKVAEEFVSIDDILEEERPLERDLSR